VMTEPQEIDDEEHEQIFQRVAAIDVAKASGHVCTRVPHETRPGKRRTRVWKVGATTKAILELADHLVCEGIEMVSVESTSDYWRPFYYLLQARGLSVQLVNARDVKNVPGRPKTDKLDSVWQAKLTERGMLRPSFVPPPEIRRLRDYTRLRTDLTGERGRHWQRLEKLLEDALIKVSSVASTMDTLSVRDMLEALIAGERNPRVLAGLARGRMRAKHAALVEALTGQFDDHHAELARLLLDQIDALAGQIDKLTGRIEELIAATPAAQPPTDPPHGDHTDSTDSADTAHAAHSAHADPELPEIPEIPGTALPAVDRLDEIPGIGRLTAQAMIAEVGLNMAQFPTAAHLVSWTKFCPQTFQSGPKTRSGKTGKGNPYLRAALGEAAAAAAKTDTFLGERYRRLVKRCGKRKALVAVGRSILVIVWHLLADPTARFHDLGPDFYDSRIDKNKKARNHIRQLQALGYRVTLEPAA